MKQPNLGRVLLLVLAPVAAAAQPAPSKQDCEVLEKLVKQYVWLAATEVRMQTATSSRRLAPAGEAPRFVCRRPVEVTTRAFGEALASLNMSIVWEPPNPGDYCLSGDFDQCYPEGRPGLPAPRLAFVYDAWQGVRDAVQSQVRAGSGGMAVFSAASLDAALADRLAGSIEGPLYSRYRSR